MIIDCISDLHGYYPTLDSGDLLIIAGDLTARDDNQGYMLFESWLANQSYRKKIIVAGNHDNQLQTKKWTLGIDAHTSYLEDNGVEFEGLKIWGTPWSRSFEGMNPHCKAFTKDSEEELEKMYRLIPKDIDILVSHCPVYGIHDKVKFDPFLHDPEDDLHVGSVALYEWICEHQYGIKLFVCGHIHEGYGKYKEKFNEDSPIFVNSSYVNYRYQPVNKPIRIIL